MSSNKAKNLAVLSLVALTTLSSCAYHVNQYSPSASNVKIMTEQELGKFNLSEFTSSKPGLKSIMCRAAGPIEAPNGETYEQYVHNALISELTLANLLDENAMINLQGKLEAINFNSNIGGGKWMISLSFTNGHEMMRIDSEYPFESYFVADKACQKVAQSFEPAVQKAISEVVGNPQFKKLLHASKVSSRTQ